MFQNLCCCPSWARHCFPFCDCLLGAAVPTFLLYFHIPAMFTPALPGPCLLAYTPVFISDCLLQSLEAQLQHYQEENQRALTERKGEEEGLSSNLKVLNV